MFRLNAWYIMAEQLCTSERSHRADIFCSLSLRMVYVSFVECALLSLCSPTTFCAVTLWRMVARPRLNRRRRALILFQLQSRELVMSVQVLTGLHLPCCRSLCPNALFFFLLKSALEVSACAILYNDLRSSVSNRFEVGALFSGLILEYLQHLWPTIKPCAAQVGEAVEVFFSV